MKAYREKAEGGVTGAEIRAELRGLRNPARAEVSQRYFKTGPGGYGQGDVFLGLSMPELRSLAKRHAGLDEEVILDLLASSVHEERMLALLVLLRQYVKAGEDVRKRVFDLYVRHRGQVNNWDLVDVSAPGIVGDHLLSRDKAILYDLAGSASLWDRRIAIISTLRFIREGLFEHTMAIAEILLADPEDLIHKAAGWMLREVGKRDRSVLEAFLERRYREMPRTMLRYAVERLPEEMRQAYLKGEV